LALSGWSISILFCDGGVPCADKLNSRTTTPFDAPHNEVMSKRRRGFPSETRVKAGVRTVHGDKLLAEKLGRNDLCPCGSDLRFKRCCLKSGRF
jgi:uncharacterized protein YchJ